MPGIKSDDLYLTSSKVRSEPILVLGTYALVFRFLTTMHMREVWNKAAARNGDRAAYDADVRVMTLARAVVTMNGQALILDSLELREIREKLKLKPEEQFDEVQQAEVILDERFTIRVLEAFDDAYARWLLEYEQQAIETVKKKLGLAASGTGSSGSSSTGGFSPTTPG